MNKKKHSLTKDILIPSELIKSVAMDKLDGYNMFMELYHGAIDDRRDGTIECTPRMEGDEIVSFDISDCNDSMVLRVWDKCLGKDILTLKDGEIPPFLRKI